ncbi:MAG: FkbM family methyltransferase [Actinomycetota bacterium]|jgi:FkbM family methyltransferase|nr:FkbM family methyltransferase [Actinomycetota bacterium]
MPVTLQRRLLRLLPLLGARVLDLAPGVAVLTRRRDVRVEDLGGGAWLLLRGDSRRTAKLGQDCRLIGPRSLFTKDRARRDKALSDWLLLQHLRDVLRRYRVDCVLDVGANRGQYRNLLRRAGYRGRVVSFEPVPDVFAQLAAAAADDDLWEVHQVALGREDGELDMHVVPGTLSSLLPPSAFGSARYERFQNATTMMKVPVRRLDAVLPDVLGPDLDGARILLKLDTQGFDLEAFAGASGVLDKVVALQSEVALLQIYEQMPRMQESLSVYETAGFEVTGLYPVSREARTGRVLEYDCIMVRAEAV